MISKNIFAENIYVQILFWIGFTVFFQIKHKLDKDDKGGTPSSGPESPLTGLILASSVATCEEISIKYQD